MSEEASGAGEPSEEELRAQLEEELKRIKVADVLLQTLVTLVNLGGQRLGLAEGTRDMRDLDQVRTAIEAVRSLLPLLEADDAGARQVRPIRDALSQLQLAYAREAGTEGVSPEPAREPGEGREQGPPGQERQTRPTGRLWVPPGSGR
jgi:hypothetical protein